MRRLFNTRLASEATANVLYPAFASDDDAGSRGHFAKFAHRFVLIHGSSFNSCNQFDRFFSASSQTSDFPDAFDSCHLFNSPKFNVFQREQIVMRVARRRNPGVGRFMQFLGKTDKMGGLPCSPQANKRRGVLGKVLSTSRWKRRDELLCVRD